MSIDPEAVIPLYFQLKTLLVEGILSGRYGADDRLPTEHELVARYGISRTPVNRAMSELASEGVILRRRRRGTFVNPEWLRRQSDRAELRLVVPEGPWERQIRDAAPPHVRLTVTTVALPDLHHALIQAVAQGRAPDLAILDSVWVTELAASGFLAPLDELAADWLDRQYQPDFLDPFVTANQFSGRCFAVQAEADVAGLWYRIDDVPLPGGRPPATWHDLAELGGTLAAAGWPGHALVMPGGRRAGETTTYCLLALLASNGASVLSGDGVTLDSPAAVQTLRYVRQLVDSGVMSASVVSYEWDQAVNLLGDGQATMALGGSYDARTLARAAGLSVDRLWERFGFVAVPGGPRGGPATLAGGMAYGIFRQAAHPELAMSVLEQLVSTDALVAMSRASGQIPPRRSALQRVTADFPFLAATAELLDRAAVRPATPSYARVSEQLQAMLEHVLTGRLRPAAAAERTAELVSAITGRPVRHD